MLRTLYIFIGLAVITLASAGLTEVTLALGGRSATSDGTRITTAPHPSRSVAIPTPMPSTLVTPTPSPVATPTPKASPAAKTATVAIVTHLRAQPSTSGTVISTLDPGTIVTLGSYVDTQWQGVSVNGVSGYVYRGNLSY